jgi:hypothetical protein
MQMESSQSALCMLVLSQMAKRKNPHAVALGRKGGIKGGAKGGKATAATRTPEERSEAARKAVKARWERWARLRSDA